MRLRLIVYWIYWKCNRDIKLIKLMRFRLIVLTNKNFEGQNINHHIFHI